jgi:seryl-tRNA synthetase
MSFRNRLIEAGRLVPLGTPGLYGRDGTFEAVAAGLEALITQLGAGERTETLRLPPGMSMAAFARTGYMRNFPQLAGTVHCFCGDERAHRQLVRQLECSEDWTAEQRASEVALVPASCYPVYGLVAARGPLPEGGAVVDVAAWCFRHEPSDDPMRQQMFRMREYVRLGTPDQAIGYRNAWVERGQAMARRLGLNSAVDIANDPFFGRAGRVLASGQRDQALKLELLIPVGDDQEQGACMSFNAHRDSFGHSWGLRTADGAVAHTACVGFGIERLTLALFSQHGLDPADWPPPVRAALHL